VWPQNFTNGNCRYWNFYSRKVRKKRPKPKSRPA
jgi:hypothetical protein